MSLVSPRSHVNSVVSRMLFHFLPFSGQTGETVTKLFHSALVWVNRRALGRVSIMLKKVTLCWAALLFASGLALASQSDKAASGTWSGTVTDSICGAKNAGPAGAACTRECVSKKGAKLALYDASSKKVYLLEPQDKVTGHEGHYVIVKGTLDKDNNTIHIASLSMSMANGM